MKEKISVACVQLRSGVDVDENLRIAGDYIREAKEKGVDFVVTPENTPLLDRRPGELFKKAEGENTNKAVSFFRDLAKELKVLLLIGSIPIKIAEEKCVNRSFLIGKAGEVIATYDKIHMFDVVLSNGEKYQESANYQPGEKVVLAKTSIGNIGMTTCYDIRFPHLYRDLAKKGAQIITIPSSFTKTTGEAHWHTLVRARAIETGSYVAAPAQGGVHEDGRETYGHSLIVSPWGEILAEAGTEPGIISAEIDLSLVDSVRKQIPSLQHDREYNYE